MAFVSRDSNRNINGVFAVAQPGYAEEQLADNDPAVLAYLTPSVVPKSVSPRQARLALLAAGLLDQVTAAVNAAGGAPLITWEYATEFLRTDPLIKQIGTSLNLSDAVIDQLFITAATL